MLDFFRLTRHNLWMLVATTLLGVLGGAVFSLLQPTLYQTTSSGYVVAGSSESVASASAGSSLAERKAGSYVPLVNSGAVREGIAAELKDAYPQGVRLAGMVAQPLAGTNQYRITVTAPTAAEARDIANAAMEVVAREALRLESMTADGTSTGESAVRLVPIEQAPLPSTPVSPTWSRNLPLGAVVGLALGYVLALVRRSVDGRIRVQTDLDEVSDSAVLGIIPRSDLLKSGQGQEMTDMGPTGEALRHLRTNLRFVSVDNPPRSIVVSSANPSEGKSTIAASLARLLAQSGQPVVLIDADLRRPRQAARFGLESDIGVTQVLTGDVPLEDALQETQVANLRLLAAGRIPPNPSELVGSQRMRTIIERLSQDGLVIIDAPPVLPVTDAPLLTAAADGAILVAKTGKTLKEQVRQSVKLLRQVNGTLLGTVLNQTPARSMGSATYGYGYGGYTSEYTSDRRRGEPTVEGARAKKAAGRRSK